jgi:sugar transferase (PEP-CTERM system associated)
MPAVWGGGKLLRIFRHYLSASALGLFLLESSVIVSAFYAAARAFAPLNATTHEMLREYLAVMLVTGIISSLLMYSIGLYDRWLIGNVRRAFPRLVACFAICTPVIILLMMFNLPAPEGVATGHQALVYTSWAALAFTGVLVSRVAYAGITRSTAARRRVLVVGVGKLAAEIEFMLSRQSHADVEVVGYTAFGNEAPLVPQSRIKPGTKSLLQIARANGVREIVVALDDRRGVPLDSFLEARMEGITVTNYLSFWEREMRRVNLKALDPSWLIYSDGFRISSETNALLKRLFDIGAGVALLILGLPVFVFGVIAVRFSSSGPIFYKQDRVGRNGVTFTIYKFRTMRTDAESNGIPQWASVQDPRITGIGSFLRKWRIDELPQILNVLHGDMSFVGPRPERPFFVQSLTKDVPYYSQRHRMRPGITGWAQINYPYGASIEDAEAKLAYDLYYIKNYSFMFDLLIMLSTAHAVFSNKGGR